MAARGTGKRSGLKTGGLFVFAVDVLKRLVSRVHLGGIIEGGVIVLEKIGDRLLMYCEAIDNSNSAMVYGLEDITDSGITIPENAVMPMKLGFSDFGVLSRFFAVQESAGSKHILFTFGTDPFVDEGDLWLAGGTLSEGKFKPNGRKLKYLLTRPGLVKSLLDADSLTKEQCDARMDNVMNRLSHFIPLTRDICNDFIIYAQLLKATTHSLHIVAEGDGGLCFVGGEEYESQFRVNAGIVPEDLYDDGASPFGTFSTVYSIQHVVKVFASLLDEPDWPSDHALCPSMYLGNGCPLGFSIGPYYWFISPWGDYNEEVNSAGGDSREEAIAATG